MSAATATIAVGQFSGLAWIRPEGKGNFLAGPALKACADAEVQRGCERIVVDLEACSSVDSTFMGAIVTIAKSLRAKLGRGHDLEIADANDTNARAMMDLGLSSLVKINPAEAEWQQQKQDFRTHLHPSGKNDDQQDRGDFVLKAHKELVAAFPENEEKFSSLIDMLEKQQSAKSR